MTCNIPDDFDLEDEFIWDFLETAFISAIVS